MVQLAVLEEFLNRCVERTLQKNKLLLKGNSYVDEDRSLGLGDLPSAIRE